jgi:hypothetical protein
MIKKLFFMLLFALGVSNANAQSIGLIGAFNSWGGDVTLNTTDNVTYTLSNFTLLANSELKFRQDGAWAINWGAADWPSGVGTQGGANILGLAGVYNVTFNITTGAYSFVAATVNYDVIGFNGGFNNFGATVPMGTLDGIAYVKLDYQFTANGVKFVRDSPVPPTTWGNTTFPSGTATVNGATIPLTPAFYNVDFNKNTLAYNFVAVPVSIVGDAAIDFSTDIDMTTTDGINFTLLNQALIGGKHLKFRTNYSWSTNWGGTAFPIGTGALAGSDILVDVSGTYNITFNRVSGDYVFTLLSSAYDQIDITGAFNPAGVVLNTTDGITYAKNDYYFSATTGLKFSKHTDATVFWGSTTFPVGTATLSGGNIPVPVGNFNVMFNKTTLGYSFETTPVSITGGAGPGWGNDIDLVSTDNGITFTGTNIALTVGDFKFRSNHDYTIAWGGSTTFPSGTASTTGSGNLTIPVASTYNVTFNRVTGDYNFVDTLGVTQFGSSNVGLYPNPTSSTFSMNVAFEKVQVYAITGQLVKSFTKTLENQSLNISDLNNGIYFVKGADANGNEKTVKLIKQ